MIILKKKKSFVKIDEVYYCGDYSSYETDADVIMFIQAANGIENSKVFNTLHIKLDRSESEIFDSFEKKNRQECRRAEKENVICSISFNPKDDEIKEFCTFQNDFAKEKGLNPCSYEKLLRFKEIGVLVISKAKVNFSDKICSYHVHLANTNRARTLFAVSNYHEHDDSNSRNMVGRANRYLFWNDIKEFKYRGIPLFDFGGIALKDDDQSLKNIDRFKKSFGGDVVSEYTFYLPKTVVGTTSIKLTKKKI